MSVELLTTLAGAVLALVFEYWSWLEQKYDALPSDAKGRVMLVATAVIALAVYGANCGNLAIPGLPPVDCTVDGLTGLAWLWLLAAGGSQGAYLTLVKPRRDKPTVTVGSVWTAEDTTRHGGTGGGVGGGAG